MLFLSVAPQLSLNSSTFSYSSFYISSSLIPKSNHNPHPNSIPIIHSTNNNPSPNSSVSSSDPNCHSDAPIKMPTPPWMKGPLLLQPHQVLDFSNPNSNRAPNKAQLERERSDEALTAKESVARGKKKIMKKIVQRVEKLHKSQNSTETLMGSAEIEFGDSLERLIDGDDDYDDDDDEGVGNRRRMPWEKDESVLFLRMKKEKVVTTAELTLDKVLLQRLRSDAARMRTWVKVKKAGVTQAVVDEIKRTWRRNELAMVKFDVPLCRNMDRAREIVETKTGGLVVWSKKDTHVIYRGYNPYLTSKGSAKIYTRNIHSQRPNPFEMNGLESVTEGDLYWVESKHSLSDMFSLNAGHKDSLSTTIQDMNCESVSGSLHERETDRLLDGLGPRFIDWWMHKPLPVDADLLPEVVPGFKPPFRLCPPRVKGKLADNELTYLRKLAHPLPTHFVLGTFLLDVILQFLFMAEKT